MGSARVYSIESLVDFRAKLVEFGKDAKDVLCAVEMQLRRATDWLTQKGKYWHKEIRVRQEEVVRAKNELLSRKNMCKDGRGPGTTDQEKALRKAQARLKEAEDKLASCKRWGPLLQHAIHEYHGPARQLSGALDADLIHAVAILKHKIEALEAYLAIEMPAMPGPSAAASTAEGPVLVESTAATSAEKPAATAEKQDEPANSEETEKTEQAPAPLVAADKEGSP